MNETKTFNDPGTGSVTAVHRRLTNTTYRFGEEHWVTLASCAPLTNIGHLLGSEKPLFSFLAFFAALFSIRVFWGFFLFCFLLSFPLLI
jgi:hypothetical protein